MAKLCIVGEWHQALVLGACFSELGHDVRGAVGSGQVAERLYAGLLPVEEPGLTEMIRREVAARRLRYTPSYEDALNGVDYAFIALDTPIADDDRPELDRVVEAAQRIGASLSHDVVLVVTAQVPVGVSDRLRDIVAEQSGRNVALAYVPEFLRLGQAVQTFREADRFIIGCDDDEVAAQLDALYSPLERPVLHMDVRSAEMTKHACNAFLALSISFANEVADLCSELGSDMDAVIQGMKLDRRIGPHAYLSAGLGFAGGTLGRDLRALQLLGQQHGRATRLVDATLAVNAARAALVRHELETALSTLSGRQIGILGLTYKPGTSAMRRSIALEIIRDLVAVGAEVAAYDPLANFDDVADPPRFTRVANAYAAAAGADAVVLITEWAELEALDFGRLRSVMQRPLFIDARNRLDPGHMAELGFTYVGAGRSRQRRRAAVEVNA